jgi:hypothetical protein
MPVKKQLPFDQAKNKARQSRKTTFQRRSFSLLNRGGKLSLRNTLLTESVNNAQNNNTGKFLNWCMPEEETG